MQKGEPMKLIIDIPNEYYEALKAIPANQLTADMLVIRNGISFNDMCKKQPEIIRCKDCVKHNRQIGDIRDDGQLQYGNYYWKDEACPLAEYRGKAQGHEFDYQYCSFAERRVEECGNQ